MPSSRVIALCLACLAALGAAVWLLGDSGPAPAEQNPSRPVRLPEPQPGTAPENPTPSQPEGAATSEPDPDVERGQLWLQGRVFAAGRPLADAEVELRAAPLPADAFSPEQIFRAALAVPVVLATTHADGEGRFRLPLPGAGRYQLGAHGPGWGWDFLDIAAESSRSGLRLELPAAQDIAGVVLDASGRPVPEARLQLLELDLGAAPRLVQLRATSDAQGRFAFAAAEAPAHGFVLWAHAPDGRSTALDRVVPPQPELLVQLPPAGSMRGQLRLAGGALVDAELLLLGEHGARMTRSDLLGSYSFENLSAGRWQLSVSTPTRQWQGELELAAGEAAVFDLQLEASASLALRLRDEAGAGVADAHVVAWCLGSGSRSRQDGHGDAAGRLRLEGLVPGALSVFVRAPGRAPTAVHLTDSALVAGKTLPLEVTLPAAASLSGRLLDETGEPWQGAVLRVYDEGWQLVGLQLPASAPTDPQGGFLLEGLPAGEELELRCEPGGGPPRNVLLPGLQPGERRVGVEVELRR